MTRDLEESEEQFQTAMRSHMMNIEVLINLNDCRMRALEKNFQDELQILQTNFHEEKNEITLRYKLEKMELAAIIETIEKEEQERETDVSPLHNRNLYLYLYFPLSSPQYRASHHQKRNLGETRFRTTERRNPQPEC